MKNITWLGLGIFGVLALAASGCTVTPVDEESKGGETSGGSSSENTAGTIRSTTGGSGGATGGAGGSLTATGGGGASNPGSGGATSASGGGVSSAGTGGLATSGHSAVMDGAGATTGGRGGTAPGTGSINPLAYKATALASPEINHSVRKITGGAVWSAGNHVFKGGDSGDIYVEEGVLEVAPCSTIQMPKGTSIHVENGGALKFLGTRDCPITVTSAEAAPTRGDWGEVWFSNYADNAKNQFDWVVVEYGGGSELGSLQLAEKAELAMSNSVVRESKDYGIEMDGRAILHGFTGNALIKNSLGPIHLPVDSLDQLGVGTYQPNEVEGIQVEGGSVYHDQSWAALDTPYILTTQVNVGTSSQTAHLTVKAGATLKCAPAAGFEVRKGSLLTLAGTSTAHVTVTAADPAKGWGTVSVDTGSKDLANVFSYTDFIHGNVDNYDKGSIAVDGDSALTLDTVTFTEGGVCDVTAWGQLNVSAGIAPRLCDK